MPSHPRAISGPESVGLRQRKLSHRKLAHTVATRFPGFQLASWAAARKVRTLRKKYRRVFKALSSARLGRYNADNTNELLRLTLNNAYHTICMLRKEAGTPSQLTVNESSALIRPPSSDPNIPLEKLGFDLVAIILGTVSNWMVEGHFRNSELRFPLISGDD